MSGECSLGSPSPGSTARTNHAPRKPKSSPSPANTSAAAYRDTALLADKGRSIRRGPASHAESRRIGPHPARKDRRKDRDTAVLLTPATRQGMIASGNLTEASTPRETEPETTGKMDKKRATETTWEFE